MLLDPTAHRGTIWTHSQVSELSPLASRFLAALLALDKVRAHKMILEASYERSLLSVIESAVVPALEELGQRWTKGKISLAELYMAGRYAEQIVHSLFPDEELCADLSASTAICLFEDHHALGKRVVSSILWSSGFRIRDYGQKNLHELVSKVEEDGIRTLLCSVLMLRSATRIADLRVALDARKLDVTLVVGGAPFRFAPELGLECGADYVGLSAADAVGILRSITLSKGS